MANSKNASKAGKRKSTNWDEHLEKLKTVPTKVLAKELGVSTHAVNQARAIRDIPPPEGEIAGRITKKAFGKVRKTYTKKGMSNQPNSLTVESNGTPARARGTTRINVPEGVRTMDIEGEVISVRNYYK